MSGYNSFNDFGRRPEPEPEPQVPSACPACHSPSIATTAKSPNENSYWRCERCGEIWNMSRRAKVRSGARTWR